MQILYIAREPLDAESAANALRDVVPNVDVRWASRFDQAEVWIDTHHDLAALLVDVQADDQDYGAFLTSFRRRGIDAAIVLITPEGSSPPGSLLSAGADECAEKGTSFSRSLNDALARALVRARAQGSGRWDHLRLSAGGAARQAIDDHLSRTMGDEMAADRLAECQTAVEVAISLLFPATNDSCSALSSRLTDIEATFDAVTAELSDCRSQILQLTGREAQLTARLSEAEAAGVKSAERRAELELHLAQETASLAALGQQLAETRTAAEDAERSSRDERSAFSSQIHALSSERAEAEHALAQARRSYQETLDRVSSEHAAACGQFEQKLCDADLALDSLRREHVWAVAENERLTRRGTELASQLDESRATILKQFEESPLPTCRCTHDGRLTTANRAFVQLVGHSSLEDLRNVDLGEAVFESAGDLRWLLERSISSAAVAPVEATWRTKEGSRLTVRVTASATAPGAIELAAEDLTRLRSLEERLGPAQRMESVGRLASEVAVTCANLLGDVHQDVQRWLKTANTDASLRHQGEMLLDEVTRASGFLRQLAAYGDEQTNALSPVDLNKVLRDLGPVLKRVAGDEVDLDLPRTVSPLIVDVPALRVERLLVNLAAYGRERMPFGGRLNIEVATVTLDQAFLEKYPNVRRGQHALITATETRRTTRSEGPLRLHEWPVQTRRDRESSASLGVDLGALQDLIRGCGGHLWVTAVPHGDMVVRIHLPLRSADAGGATIQPQPAVRLSTLGLTGSLIRH